MEIIRVVKGLFEPEKTFTNRVIKGGFWVFLAKGFDELTGFVKMVVLARLLAPSDFGLMGIAMFSLSIIGVISDPGFKLALIQKKGDIKDYLDTAWLISFLRGMILCLIVFLLSPLIAHFFEAPEAASVVRVLSLTFLLNGVVNIGVIQFAKDLDFRKNFFFSLSNTLTTILIAIPLAFLFRNVWALVFASLAGTAVNIVVSYIMHPYRPSLKYDSKKAKDLFGFGKWITGSNIIILLLDQGDSAFVGKFLGANALGFYAMAYKLSNMPATEITNVISNVAFAAYSRLQDDIRRLKEGYLKTLRVTAFISIPLAGGIFVLAPEFTRIFLGDKWMPMVSTFQVLSLWGMLRSIIATKGPLFRAAGKPEVLTKIVLIRLVIMAALIYPLSLHWGIFGTSLSVLLSALFLYPFEVYMTIKIVNFKVRDYCKTIFPSLVNTAFMVSLIFILKYYLIIQIRLLQLLMLIILGTLSYFVVAYGIEKSSIIGVKDIKS